MSKKIRWKVRQSIYTLDAGIIKIVLTNGHIHYPGEWLMFCEPWFRHKKLDVETLDEAKGTAILLVIEQMRDMTNILESLFPGFKEAKDDS